MRRSASALGSLVAAVVLPIGFAAGQDTPSDIHLGHVMEGFVGAPGGLLAMALAETEVVVQHARLGAQDPSDLDAMRRHAGHVIHALDPSTIDEGPGNGYGLVRAAGGVGVHAQLAARAEGSNDVMANHGMHVRTSAENTVRRAQRVLALAEIIREHVDSAADAALLFEDLVMVADRLMTGWDDNEDGQINWQDGGLDQVEQHMGFMVQAAGGD